MNLSKQIKKYRERDQLSQEQLAEKIYVSRQTISNWENEKSYPDIHNLLLLSVLFDVSLDELVKGDLEIMKTKMKNKEADKWTKVMLIFMLGFGITVGPLTIMFAHKGFFASLILWGVAMYAAFKVERWKKQNDIQTFREITAFIEQREMTSEEQEKNQHPYLEKIVIVFIFTAIFVSLAFGGLWLSEYLFGK